MDTVTNPPTPAADERLAEIERQLAELQHEFDLAKFQMEMAFAAGRASITNPTRPQELFQRPRHLRVVSGGAR